MYITFRYDIGFETGLNIENNTQKSLQAAEDAKASADTAYMMDMIGVGLGAAGIIVAVIMSRRNIS
jgi:hypothetical protein